jgi:hypothetical protein
MQAKMKRTLALLLPLILIVSFPSQPPAYLAKAVDGLITFNDDGAWSWFEDERAIVDKGKLIIGSVAAGARDERRKGAIEVVTYDIAAGRKRLSELRDRLLDARGAYDDHNSPALLVRPDGRVLAVYSRHGAENKFYYRVSTSPHDATRWQPEQSFTPSVSSRITYSNLHYLSKENKGKGRVYNFYRGFNDSFKPSYCYSDDGGETWIAGNIFIDVSGRFRHRPYVKYASDGLDAIHIFYTEGHPRNFDNNAYHIFYRGGKLHRSDGTIICSLAEGLKDPSQGARIFQGDPNNVAWVSDIQLDAAGRRYVAYSVQKDSAGLAPGRGGEDLRYRYARWTGKEWVDYEIAYAGSRLYAGEDDYPGNIALDPDDPNTVYLSTNADPVSGQPLISSADKQRHYEIFKGATGDGGRSWRWGAVTGNSTRDNIRPIVPKWDGKHTALIWLRGRYSAYTNYELELVGTITTKSGR